MSGRALIIGGSLGELTTALALADTGIASTVLERTKGRTQRGVAILVAGSSIGQTVSPAARDIIAGELGENSMRQGSLPHSWWSVYSALRHACEAEELVTLVEDVHVAEVGEDSADSEDSADGEDSEAGTAWARDDNGDVWRADLLVGADGYRSVVRRYVDAAKPDADYAGYVTWLGQSELPAEWQDDAAGGPDFFPAGRRMLAVYPLIEADGRVDHVGWGVIDPTWNSLLREIGALDGTRVLHTPRATDIPDKVYEGMANIVEKHWDEPWAPLVAEAFHSHDVIATPINEYVPDRVTTGRIATVGDAAHAQTLMTGAGFREAVDDAHAIARALSAHMSDGAGAAASAVPEALFEYEAMRLDPMRMSVQSGQSFSRAFAG